MGGTNGEDHGESEQRAQDSSTGKTKHDLRNTALLIELVLAQKIAPVWVVNMGRTNVKKHKLSNSKLIRGPKMPPNMNKTHNLKPPLQRLLWPQESPPGIDADNL